MVHSLATKLVGGAVSVIRTLAIKALEGVTHDCEGQEIMKTSVPTYDSGERKKETRDKPSATRARDGHGLADITSLFPD